jgi:hypothetical protein
VFGLDTLSTRREPIFSLFENYIYLYICIYFFSILDWLGGSFGGVSAVSEFLLIWFLCFRLPLRRGLDNESVLAMSDVFRGKALVGCHGCVLCVCCAIVGCWSGWMDAWGLPHITGRVE